MESELGMELTKAEIAKALERPADQPALAAAHLERFNADQLAQVLEQEIVKATASGLSHIRLSMNLADGVALSKALRTAAKMGH